MKTVMLSAIVAIFFLAACGNSEGSNATDNTEQDSAAMTVSPENAANPMADMTSAMDNMMVDLKAINLTGDADYDFASIMRTHHKGAVAMMQAYLAGAGDGTLKQMAQTGIAKQQPEIEELDTYIANHVSAKGSSEYGKNAVQMITDMMAMDKQPDNADKAFAMMMAPHHESAVHISQMYDSEAKDAKLKAMAKKIASEQQQETEQLTQWLQQHP